MIESTGRPATGQSYLDELQNKVVLDGQKITLYNGATLMGYILTTPYGIWLYPASGKNIGIGAAAYILGGVALIAPSNEDVDLFVSGTGAIDANTAKIKNVIDPTSDQEAATKKYVDDAILAGGGLNNIVEDLTPQLGGNLDPNGKQISGGWIPSSNGVYDLGSITKAWSYGYIYNDLYTFGLAPISGSSIALKTNLLPSVADTYSLGSATYPFLNIHWSGTQFIYYLDTSTEDYIASMVATSTDFSISAVSGKDISLNTFGAGRVKIAQLNTVATNAGRAKNTTFTNSSGKPLLVIISISLISTNTADLKIHATADPPTTIVSEAYTEAALASHTLIAIVPVGWTYRLVCASGSGAVVAYWHEVELG